MAFIIWFTTAVCASLAFVTLLWSIGFVWPARTEAGLTRSVIGAKGREQMPWAWPMALYTVIFIVAAIWPLYPSGVYHKPVLAALAILFSSRGLLSVAGAWGRLRPEQPFARYDRLIYGPLAVALGLGFAAIWWTS